MEAERTGTEKPIGDSLFDFGLCEKATHEMCARILVGRYFSEEDYAIAARALLQTLVDYRMRGNCGPKCEQSPGHCLRRLD
jgi:hypothetical protein